MFFSFWGSTIVSPQRTFREILRQDSVCFGFGSLLLYSFLYVITGLFLVINHLQPTVPPLLPINEESYYFWQLFFTFPVSLLGWLVLGCIAYLLTTKLLKANGSLKDYLKVLGFSFYIPCIITMWLPETLTAIFHPEWWGEPSAGGTLVRVVSQIYLYVGFIWAFALSMLAIKETSSASWFKSALIALLSIAVTMGFYLIFIR